MTGSSSRSSLGVVLTHPVQYFAPLFRELAQHVDLTVYYGHRPTPAEQGAGFGVAFEWDVDLTSGYHHVWLHNRAARADLTTFSGCDTPQIGGLLGAARHDAVLVAGWHALTYWQAMLACWRRRIPVMVRGDSQLEGQRSVARQAIKHALYPRFIRRFAACLSVGTRSKEYFQHFGARAIFFSPHFVDNEFFAVRAAQATRDKVRDQFGIADDAVVVLFAGKLAPKKRPMDVVTAVAQLGDPRLHILFAGDGELRPALTEAVVQQGLRATFAGFMNQTRIPQAYAAANFLVLPSDARETWGLVVNEAMACGLPAVVSSACGCAPDLILNGTTGLQFACGDVGGLTQHIVALSRSRNMTIAMGAAARDHIATFNVHTAASGVLHGLQHVLAKRES